MTCLRHGRKAGGYWAAQNGRSRRSQSCGDRSISALGVARSPSEEISALSTGLPKHQLNVQKGQRFSIRAVTQYPSGRGDAGGPRRWTRLILDSRIISRDDGSKEPPTVWLMHTPPRWATRYQGLLS
ncbi:hypothetical protein NDU88_001046 [Pleurodeles waltl]|uniref:Uncharacterized protein n=1 Tax=Pleurodeles waltl TaxID=8319 RepID=A0AAV7P5V3_PLEWA|nr:hypothetical protein NDU88_001046 [Pleurodeles waltl]